jgi:molybdate transport system regulatory protein
LPYASADVARVRVSIVFKSGARIGPGKTKLLESIRDTGSISAAAREMGMSYKRAWVLLDSINQAFTEPVVTAAPGGVGGGGAILTAFGAEVLERYNRILDRAANNAVDDLACFVLGVHGYKARLRMLRAYLRVFHLYLHDVGDRSKSLRKWARGLSASGAALSIHD